METPSSSGRVTRSQALAAAAANTAVSKKFEESEKKATISRNGNEQERSALFDITNDSPVVGLAMGSLETPSSAISKKRVIINTQSKHTKTPGSGEALLRGQVKTLLQKVEEEAELSKLAVEYRPFLHLKGIVNSPTGLLAPTPANTPHLNLSGNGLPSVTPSPVEEKFLISQMIYGIFDGKKEEEIESEKSMVTRSLFLEFTEKLDSLECENKEKTPATDDDDSSVWSIQVNASSIRDEEDYDEEEEEDCDECYEEDEEEEEVSDGGLVELCEGISKISVNGERAMAAKFTRKHTRFVYNNDGELEGVVEEEAGGDARESAAMGGVLHLKGLPTPKGMHLRFPAEVN